MEDKVEEQLSNVDDDKVEKTKIYKEEQDLDRVQLQQGRKRSPLGIPENLMIPDKDWKNLENEIGEYFDVIHTSKEPLREKLSIWNKAILQEPTDDDFVEEPFEGSCKLCSALTASNCVIIHRKIMSTILVEPYYLAVVEGDKEAEARLRDYAAHKCRYDINFNELVEKAAWYAVTSPYVILVPEKVREIVTHHDFKIFENQVNEKGEEIEGSGVAAFKEIYSTPEDGLLNSEEYAQKIKDVALDIEEFGYHECHYDYDVVESKSVGNVVHIEKYFKFPWNSSVPSAKLVGHTIEKTFDDLLRLERDKILKEGKTGLIVKRYTNPEDSENKSDTERDFKEVSGLDDTDEEKINYRTKNYPICKGVIRLDKRYAQGVDKDIYVEQDYEFWWALDEKVLLRLAPYRYNYKKRNYIEVSIDRTCVPAKTQNAYDTQTTLIRQFIDGNSFANVPEMVVSQATMNRWTQKRTNMKHKVGKIWVAVSGEIKVLEKERPDGGAYLSIIRYIGEDTETRTGGSRTAAGQTLSEDPQAPGIKTAMLLQQSDKMIEKYIKGMRPGFSELMKHFIYQDRQEMKSETVKVTRYDKEGRPYPEDFGREQLRFVDEDTQFVLRNQKVDDNEQIRKQESRMDLELYGAIPLFQNRPKSMKILARNSLMRDDNYTMEEVNELLPTDEEIDQQQVSIDSDMQQAAQAGQKIQGIQQDMQNQTDKQEQEVTQQIENTQIG